MGRALGAFIWVMTLLSVWMFMNGRWWFPPSISEHGPAYDQQFLLTIIVVGVAFAIAQVALGYAVWRFRDTGEGTRAVYSHGNNRLEIDWTIVTAVIFIGNRNRKGAGAIGSSLAAGFLDLEPVEMPFGHVDACRCGELQRGREEHRGRHNRSDHPGRCILRIRRRLRRDEHAERERQRQC